MGIMPNTYAHLCLQAGIVWADAAPTGARLSSCARYYKYATPYGV